MVKEHSKTIQRQRLLERLRKGTCTTFEARHQLDIIGVAPRIFELRHHEGFNIQKHWSYDINPGEAVIGLLLMFLCLVAGKKKEEKKMFYSSQTKNAAVSETAAYCKSFDKNNFNRKFKIKPVYYKDFLTCKNQDFIFLTNTWSAINSLRRLGCRFCMLCEDLPALYDLKFCFEKEVWVIYDDARYLDSALNLGYMAQRQGAKKILIINVNLRNLMEIEHAIH